MNQTGISTKTTCRSIACGCEHLGSKWRFPWDWRHETGKNKAERTAQSLVIIMIRHHDLKGKDEGRLRDDPIWLMLWMQNPAPVDRVVDRWFILVPLFTMVFLALRVPMNTRDVPRFDPSHRYPWKTMRGHDSRPVLGTYPWDHR